VPDLRASEDEASDFGQMGLRIPAVVVSPYARRGHVDHSVYGFESILKMIRYRYALPPLTPRDLYANNIAAAFDWKSKPRIQTPSLPKPAHVMATACSGTTPADSGGVGVGVGTVLGSPPGPPAADPQAQRAKPHDLQKLLTSGYLERLGFKYRPATPSTMYRHPSKLGMRP
jgi:phospholipase C